MHIIFRTSIVAASLFAGFAAQAQQTNPYFGASLTQVEYKESGFPTASPLGVTLKLGTQVSPYLAVEARLGTGVQNDTIVSAGVPVEVKLKNYYGGYVKGIAPLSDVFQAYGLLGYTRGKIEARSGAASATSSDGDISYGLGGEWFITKKLSLNLEWARLFKGDTYKVNGISLGVTSHF